MLNAIDGRAAWRSHVPTLFTIVATSLLAGIPVLRFGIPYGMDSAEHLSWYRCFVAQLWAGEWYPRWLQAMNGGLGSPDLFVYGPLPYYAAAAFHLFSRQPGREVYELGYSMVIALMMAGMGAYLWLRQLAGGRLAPTIGALIYMLVPYYLKTDLYTRSALAEFWAFTWMPLILYFTVLWLDGQARLAWLGLAVAWALLLLTHLFTAMLFAPVAVLYAAVLAKPRERTVSVLMAVSGILVGAGAAAFYLFPAFAYEKYVSAYKLIQTRSDYHFERNFLFSPAAPTPYLNSLSRSTAWTVAVAALFLVTGLSAKRGRARRESAWWGTVAFVSLLLMVPASAWFWKHVSLLGAIQFPSRLNTLLTVATAALAALAMETLRQNWRWRRALPLALALLLAAGWIVPLVRGMSYQSASVQQARPLDYLITAWAQWTNPKLISLYGIPIDAGMPQVAPENGSATVERWEPRLIEFHVDSPSKTWVTVKQFYFPGWAAFIAERRLPLRPSSFWGLTMVQVPAGASQVRLKLERGVPEVAGMVLSGITFISLLIIAFLPGFQSLRSKREA